MKDFETRCMNQELTIERLRRELAEAQRDKAIAQRDYERVRRENRKLRATINKHEATAIDSIFSKNGAGQ